MKKSHFLAALGTAFIASQSQGQILIYDADLSGAAETPANSSPGTGYSKVTIDLGLNTMRVEASFAGLTGNTTAAHIHVRNQPSDLTGGVATQTPTFVGFPLGVTSGTYDRTFDLGIASTYRTGFINDSGGTVELARARLLTAMEDGRTYFNLHSQTFPGGELRGDLQAVPEPGTLSLIALGLAAVARKKRAR